MYGPALPSTARRARRGNSVYFPDRVVPMLPEELSNHWCSLRPDEDRGCLFVEMRIDRTGRKTFASFRARSDAQRGATDLRAGAGGRRRRPTSIVDPRAALRCLSRLLAARLERGTLDLDLPERKVSLSPSGEVLAVSPRPRLDSHRLIEEFMVLANVAAAEELERLTRPSCIACMPRRRMKSSRRSAAF